MQESLKRALPQEFNNKTTDKALKCLKSTIKIEFKKKGNNIRIETKQYHHGKD